jgi:hypothetical protein
MNTCFFQAIQGTYCCNMANVWLLPLGGPLSDNSSIAMLKHASLENSMGEKRSLAVSDEATRAPSGSLSSWG